MNCQASLARQGRSALSALARLGNGQESNAQRHERGAKCPEDRQVSGQANDEKDDPVGEKYETDDQEALNRIHDVAPYEA